ncbi:TIGR02594 family protein [Aeromonas sobria]|uniref:TIGR02594 family protein n=1 Tax=Aeromonas sobria TaxID=646 RepID=UPI00111A46D7|nr:TIGR02594 family protein [Aeromonas sobria]TNI85197.1 TIGR02594 family protein [Aeromonas sobria]
MTQRWVEEARRHIGLIEIKGSKHNPEIVAMWKAIKRGGIKDDETPWCAGFVGACLERVGVPSTRFEGARSYASWGEKLDKPVAGCVVVFSRDGGGHVGFVVGQDHSGNLLVLGGNQDDAVNVKAFKRHRATAYRWPTDEPIPGGELPVMAAAEFSKSEA